MKFLNILILLLSYTNVSYLYIAFLWNMCFCLEILLGNSNMWILALHVIANMSLVSNVLSLQTPSLLGNILLIPCGPAQGKPPPRCLPRLLQAASVTSSFILQCLVAHAQNGSSHVRMWLIPQHPAGQESHLGHVYIPRAFHVREREEKLWREELHLRER